jgi:hypothetical protein
MINWDDSFSILHAAMMLNHDVEKSGDGKYLGDPTEIALVRIY